MVLSRIGCACCGGCEFDSHGGIDAYMYFICGVLSSFVRECCDEFCSVVVVLF